MGGANGQNGGTSMRIQIDSWHYAFLVAFDRTPKHDLLGYLAQVTELLMLMILLLAFVIGSGYILCSPVLVFFIDVSWPVVVVGIVWDYCIFQCFRAVREPSNEDTLWKRTKRLFNRRLEFVED